MFFLSFLLFTKTRIVLAWLTHELVNMVTPDDELLGWMTKCAPLGSEIVEQKQALESI